MSSLRKAIIIGAGPAGLAAALRLRQMTNIMPVVYELRPEPTTLGGAVGIPSNGLRLLDRLGVLESLLQRGSSRSDIAMYSLTGGKLGELDDLVGHARAETGYGYMRVRRVDLIDVLLEAVRKAEIPIHLGQKICDIKEEEGKPGVTVLFESGSTDKADVLIGCDGIHSAVRKMYIDPTSTPEYSGLCAMFSTIPTSRVSSHVTSKLKGLNTTLCGKGLFIVAPCTAGQDMIYWGFQREIAMPDPQGSRDGWEVQGQQEVDDFKRSLHEVLADGQGDWVDAMKELLEATEVMKFWPIYRLPLGGTWSRGRCLLIGDAAHATQPHAGQGVSLVLEDVFLMSRLLADPAQPVEETLGRFEDIRRPRVEDVFDRAAQNGNARKNTGATAQWVKEFFLRLAFLAPSWSGIANQLVVKKHTVYDIDTEQI